MLFLGVTCVEANDLLSLIPHLQNGEILRYETHARLNRHVKTKSNVATILGPEELNRDLSAVLRLSIQEVQQGNRRPLVAAETELEPADQAPAGTSTSNPPKVSFTIGRDGSLTRADGLGSLDPEQRLIWQFWLARFAFGWTAPPSGVKPGERWKTEEVEKTPTAIANLVWERQTTYVQNDRCPILPEEQCAVFLTKATLKQKSNPKDPTPEDYKLHELKTSGVAKGTNETVSYVCIKTGLLLRATEDVQQFLDVTIAKADGSNQVQYQIDVHSHFETVFLPAAAPSAR
jgi:hypothetical protein